MVKSASVPTDDDIAFMARMLGLRPGVDYEPNGCILSDKPSLGNAVFFGRFDPIANERAQLRISRLIAECEDAERAASLTILAPSPSPRNTFDSLN